MPDAYHMIDAEQKGDAWVARIRPGSLKETALRELGSDLLALIEAKDCHKLVVRFDTSECLYSALMAQLLSVRRKLLERGGRMRLCNVPPLTRAVFRVCKLEELFEFSPDLDQALRSF